LNFDISKRYIVLTAYGRLLLISRGRLVCILLLRTRWAGGLAVKELRPICEREASRNAGFKHFPGIGEEGFESFLVVPILRGQTRIEIAKLHRDLGATTIYVTHDQVEAMTLADRVVVLRDGVIEQVGTPLALYDRPANQFVAQFIGTPQMNIVSAKQMPALQTTAGLTLPEGGFVGLRPENVTLHPADQGLLQGKVDLIEALGAETLIYVTTTQGAQLVSRQNERTALRVGDTVDVHIDTDAAHVFDANGRITRTGKTPFHPHKATT